MDASPELRSKKELIENFIAGINEVDDVMTEWRFFISEEREKQLMQIITDEKLNEAETRRFLEDSFRNGEVKTTGTDIDKLMPPVSRFGGGNRAAKKQTIIEKLKAFFERFFGIGNNDLSKPVLYEPGGGPSYLFPRISFASSINSFCVSSNQKYYFGVCVACLRGFRNTSSFFHIPEPKRSLLTQKLPGILYTSSVLSIHH